MTVAATHRRNAPWTPAELEILATHPRGKSLRELEAKLGRAYQAIRKKASTHGIRRSRERVAWTEQEDMALRQTPESEYDKFFAERFPTRPYHACYQRYARYIAPLLGRAKPTTRAFSTFDRHVLLARTAAEVDNLRAFYAERNAL